MQILLALKFKGNIAKISEGAKKILFDLQSRCKQQHGCVIDFTNDKLKRISFLDHYFGAILLFALIIFVILVIVGLVSDIVWLIKLLI